MRCMIAMLGPVCKTKLSLHGLICNDVSPAKWDLESCCASATLPLLHYTHADLQSLIISPFFIMQDATLRYPLSARAHPTEPVVLISCLQLLCISFVS